MPTRCISGHTKYWKVPRMRQAIRWPRRMHAVCSRQKIYERRCPTDCNSLILSCGLPLPPQRRGRSSRRHKSLHSRLEKSVFRHLICLLNTATLAGAFGASDASKPHFWDIHRCHSRPYWYQKGCGWGSNAFEEEWYLRTRQCWVSNLGGGKCSSWGRNAVIHGVSSMFLPRPLGFQCAQ